MCKKSTGWLFQPPRPRALERTATDRTDGPDAGFRRPANVPASRNPLFYVFLSVRRKRKLPATPGRSFGCGGVIKNSPVSGAWIADGTDGRVALVELAIASRPYRRSFLYLFLCRSRSRFIVTVCSIGICISKFVTCRASLRATRFRTCSFIYNKRIFHFCIENRLSCVRLILYLCRMWSRLINL